MHTVTEDYWLGNNALLIVAILSLWGKENTWHLTAKPKFSQLFCEISYLSPRRTNHYYNSVECHGRSDLCSDGRVARMWVPTATAVLMSLSKTLYHNRFSPPRCEWVTCEGRVGGCVRSALYVPEWQQLSCILPRELRWFQEWFTSLMSRGNNVKRCNASCKSAIKMPSLLLNLAQVELSPSCITVYIYLGVSWPSGLA